MCGIAGAFDLTGTREFPSARLLAMTLAIAHRGPDDERIHIEPGLALGARRLAIVDLEGGRQPIANETGTIWVAFNGELFDYPQIRRSLIERGHQLQTRCDTEAWVHLYEDLGVGMFEHARGQFAVSLWDRDNRTLYLGRDRVGICPLYYAERDGWLLWASEVKALLASGLVAAQPDPKGVDYLFSFFSAGTSRTFFEGITSIPPGCYLRVQDGRIQHRQYWDLDFPDAGQERRLPDPSPLVDELDAKLRHAVARRLRGDVPVVSYLSGGLDSTVVLGLSSLERGAPVPSFTIGLDRAGPDERPEAAEAARSLGSPLTTLTVDRLDIASSFPELTLAAEGPVLDTSCAALLLLAKEVHRQGYKVVLTGEGADEALAGYVWYKAQKIRDVVTGRIGSALPRLVRRGFLRSIGPSLRLTPERAVGGTRPVQQDMFEMIARSRSVLYAPAMWDRLGDHDPYADLAISNERIGRWDKLNQSLYVGYKVMLAGLLMIPKGDRIAMHSSVETRYPFLDEDVDRVLLGARPRVQAPGMDREVALAQVSARVLPPRIAARPKTMFRASLSKTFLGAHRPNWVDQLLSPESIRRAGYFDEAAVARQRRLQLALPRLTPARGAFDVGLTCVVATQLWHHTLPRRTLRPPDVGATAPGLRTAARRVEPATDAAAGSPFLGHERAEQEAVGIGHPQRVPGLGSRTVADQDRPVSGLVRREAVAPSHERRVERDDVEERAEPELLLEQPADRPPFGPRRASGRRTARTGRIPACDGCRPYGRSRVPRGRRARTDTRTRRRAPRERPARRPRVIESDLATVPRLDRLVRHRASWPTSFGDTRSRRRTWRHRR